MKEDKHNIRGRYGRIISIDPDSDRSGVAILDLKEKAVTMARSMSFADLCRLLQAEKEQESPSNPTLVLIEAGWLVRSNWHLFACRTFASAADIGRRTGLCHQTGILLAQMAEDFYHFDTLSVRPLHKSWKGPDGKITHAEISRFINLGSRSSQDVRDAALLAWIHAALPIKM